MTRSTTPFTPGRLLALALTAAFLLSACGGGSPQSLTIPKDLTLAAGEIMPGTYRLSPEQIAALEDALGGTMTIDADGVEFEGFTLRCTAPPCMIRIDDDANTIQLTGTLGVAMTSPPETAPETPDPTPSTPATPSSGGGGGGGGGGNTGTNNDNGDDNANEDEESTSETTDPTALFGILWNDEDDGTTPDRPYVFQTAYTGATELDIILRDARYAELSAADLLAMLMEIRAGEDHEAGYFDRPRSTVAPTEGLLGRAVGLYGHTPGRRGASLKNFVDAGEAGVAVLVAAQGVSKGIADAAIDDATAIDDAIDPEGLFARYIARAEDALASLDAVILRLIGPNVSDPETGLRIIGGTAGMKYQEAADLETDANTLETEANDLLNEANQLQADADALDQEALALDQEALALDAWIANPDFNNLPASCISVALCEARRNAIRGVNGLAAMKRAEEAMKRAQEAMKRAQAGIAADDPNTMVDERTGKFREAADKRAAAAAKEDAAVEDQNAASNAETGKVTIAGRIDTIKTHRTAADQILAGDPEDPDNPGDIAILARCCGLDSDDDDDEIRAQQESHKAARVQAYLEGAFAIAARSSAPILLGSGTDFVTLTEREEADPASVFARADKPNGTEDAWAALGLAEKGETGDGTRTLGTASDLTDLRDEIGTTHRARALTGKPTRSTDTTAGDFTLIDASRTAADYDLDTQDRGVFYRGTWKGIDGMLYLDQVVDDKGTPDTTDDTTDDIWFFTPTVTADAVLLQGRNPELFRYTRNSDGTHTRVDYVDYGMWLEDAGTEEVPQLNLRLLAGLVGPSREGDLGMDTVVTSPLAATATYSGTAKGLSARTDSEGTSASGHFEADVSLNATFGTAPTLDGTIDAFRSANPAGRGTAHVNDAWSATLDPTALNAWDHDGTGTYDHDNDPGTPSIPRSPDAGGQVTGGTIGTGVNGVSGEWSATAYGRAAERPAGFFGGFRAEFPDGAAAGVYGATAE